MIEYANLMAGDAVRVCRLRAPCEYEGRVQRVPLNTAECNRRAEPVRSCVARTNAAMDISPQALAGP